MDVTFIASGFAVSADKVPVPKRDRVRQAVVYAKLPVRPLCRNKTHVMSRNRALCSCAQLNSSCIYIHAHTNRNTCNGNDNKNVFVVEQLAISLGE